MLQKRVMVLAPLITCTNINVANLYSKDCRLANILFMCRSVCVHSDVYVVCIMHFCNCCNMGQLIVNEECKINMEKLLFYCICTDMCITDSFMIRESVLHSNFVADIKNDLETCLI